MAHEKNARVLICRRTNKLHWRPCISIVIISFSRSGRGLNNNRDVVAYIEIAEKDLQRIINSDYAFNFRPRQCVTSVPSNLIKIPHEWFSAKNRASCKGTWVTNSLIRTVRANCVIDFLSFSAFSKRERDISKTETARLTKINEKRRGFSCRY